MKKRESKEEEKKKEAKQQTKIEFAVKSEDTQVKVSEEQKQEIKVASSNQDDLVMVDQVTEVAQLETLKKKIKMEKKNTPKKLPPPAVVLPEKVIQ